jgi:magnesium transporter
MAYFYKRYHPPGTPPGTLTEREGEAEAPSYPLKVRLIDYTEAEFVEHEVDSATACTRYLERPTHTWVHVQGDAEPDTLRDLGRMFGLHPLALEDVVNAGQRPKTEAYDEHLFVVLAEPSIVKGRVQMCQVSLFLGRGFVISFHPGDKDPFEPIRDRLRQKAARVRQRGTDYLLYALIDLVIDQGFPVLEDFGDTLEDFEEELLATPDRDTLRDLHRIKHDLVLLRRMLWPQREAVGSLAREDGGLILDDTRLYLRDCYDHSVHMMDLVESFRDITAGMLDIYLSSASNRLNEVMRVLTVIATMFIPLTFITGVYGMNFHNPDSPWAMPELDWYWGYPLAWGLMVMVAVGMLLYFRRKKWL